MLLHEIPSIRGVVVLELAITSLLDSVSWSELLPEFVMKTLPDPVVLVYLHIHQ